ncbi:MAG: DUF433 domain-containing protein [Sciscionella sp.]
MDETVLALPRGASAKLAGLSLRQIDYWAETGLVRPSVDEVISPGRRVRLYKFADLIELLVASELKARKVSLQHIRAVVAHLHERGYQRPLTELRFATLSNRVYFQHDDGSWEGGIHPDQLVLHQVLRLEPIRQRIEHSVDRDTTEQGRVERRRGVLGSKPVLAGTRVPVATVSRYLEAGHTVGEILEAFPSLTPADVEAVRHEVA